MPGAAYTSAGRDFLDPEGQTMRLVRFLPGALVLVPTLLFAQAQGRIKGVVTDAATGKRLAGAKIILTCPEISNFRRELVTDEKGGFATLIVDAIKRSNR
jgi:hypothetical protein